MGQSTGLFSSLIVPGISYKVCGLICEFPVSSVHLYKDTGARRHHSFLITSQSKEKGNYLKEFLKYFVINSGL